MKKNKKLLAENIFLSMKMDRYDENLSQITLSYKLDNRKHSSLWENVRNNRLRNNFEILYKKSHFLCPYVKIADFLNKNGTFFQFFLDFYLNIYIFKLEES